ncbi:hypothetical protein DL96DRAFT_1566032 [Flagelloscypha sp. PMI_526]|nr:hypothetical protein DL96DRAFT_1566032 [Flagelloscypha sp. PMI_526]
MRGGGELNGLTAKVSLSLLHSGVSIQLIERAEDGPEKQEALSCRRAGNWVGREKIAETHAEELCDDAYEIAVVEPMEQMNSATMTVECGFGDDVRPESQAAGVALEENVSRRKRYDDGGGGGSGMVSVLVLVGVIAPFAAISWRRGKRSGRSGSGRFCFFDNTGSGKDARRLTTVASFHFRALAPASVELVVVVTGEYMAPPTELAQYAKRLWRGRSAQKPSGTTPIEDEVAWYDVMTFLVVAGRGCFGENVGHRKRYDDGGGGGSGMVSVLMRVVVIIPIKTRDERGKKKTDLTTAKPKRSTLVGKGVRSSYWTIRLLPAPSAQLPRATVPQPVSIHPSTPPFEFVVVVTGEYMASPAELAQYAKRLWRGRSAQKPSGTIPIEDEVAWYDDVMTFLVVAGGGCFGENVGHRKRCDDGGGGGSDMVSVLVRVVVIIPIKTGDEGEKKQT